MAKKIIVLLREVETAQIITISVAHILHHGRTCKCLDGPTKEANGSLLIHD